MSYRDLRVGMTNQVRTAIGDLQCYPYPADTVTAPAFVVGALKRTGRETWEPANKLTVEALILVTRVQAQLELLDEFCAPDGTNSVQVAIEADGTLGGVITDLNVLEVEQVGVVEIGGVPYLGALVTMDVWL